MLNKEKNKFKLYRSTENGFGDVGCLRWVDNDKIADTNTMSIQEFYSEKLMDVGYNVFRNNHLLGKILTIIDSVIIDERQNKATKDIIKQTVREFSSQSI